MANKMERFTPSTRRILSLAQEAAVELRQEYLEPEHLLLAICRSENVTACQLLDENNIAANKLLPYLKVKANTSAVHPLKYEILSMDSKKSLELMVDEARKMGHGKLDSGHLLCALLRLESPSMKQIFEHFQVDREALLETARSMTHEEITGQADIGFLDALRQSFRMMLGLEKKKKR